MDATSFATALESKLGVTDSGSASTRARILAYRARAPTLVGVFGVFGVFGTPLGFVGVAVGVIVPTGAKAPSYPIVSVSSDRASAESRSPSRARAVEDTEAADRTSGASSGRSSSASALSPASASAFAAARALAPVQVSFFEDRASDRASLRTRSSSATSSSASTTASGSGACFANASRKCASSACACARSQAAAAFAARSDARLGLNASTTSEDVSVSVASVPGTRAAADHRARRADTSAAARRRSAACSATSRAAAARRPECAKNEPPPPSEGSRSPDATEASRGRRSSSRGSSAATPRVSSSSSAATQSVRECTSARLAASNGNQVVAMSTMIPPAAQTFVTNARGKRASTTSRMNPWSARSVSGAKNKHRHASRAPRASSEHARSSRSSARPEPRGRLRVGALAAKSSAQLSRASSATKAGSASRANGPAPGTGRRLFFAEGFTPNEPNDRPLFVASASGRVVVTSSPRCCVPKPTVLDTEGLDTERQSATTASHEGGGSSRRSRRTRSSEIGRRVSVPTRPRWLQRARCATTRSRKDGSKRF